MGRAPDRFNVLGALASLKERDKIAALVEGAVSEGARLTLGGVPSELPLLCDSDVSDEASSMDADPAGRGKGWWCCEDESCQFGIGPETD